jgi:CheY-like chemotaxis protein
MKTTGDNVLATYGDEESNEAGSDDAYRMGALVPAYLLVVEDDASVRDHYADILTTAGYLFDLAGNGEAGWENIQSRDYSLIITDHDMPQLTGLGLIERLGDQDYRVPVLLISGSLSSEDTRLVGLCLLGMISKPIFVASFLARIKEAISLDLPVWFTHPVASLPKVSAPRIGKLQRAAVPARL